MSIDVFAFLGKVALAGGGGTAIAYLAFKHFGAKWLDSRFQKNFQNLVHDQNKEIERLRSSLLRSIDRAAKLHQREFEALPEIWSLLSDAFWLARSLVSRVQSYPDVNRMESAQLDQFIRECKLAEWQKTQLRLEHDKTKYYAAQIYWHRLQEAKGSLLSSNISVSKNGIFLQEHIKVLAKHVLDLVWKALIEDEINHEEDVIPRLRADIDKLHNEGDALLSRLEEAIQNRLWQHDEQAP
jgi:hypothetical protein